MKKYKVIRNCPVYPFTVVKYFKTRKDAVAYAMAYNNPLYIEPQMQAYVVGKPVNVEMHHSALTRGYLRVNDAWREQYSGRFGVGYIEHTPTRDSNCSNSYHRITYYIETK